MGSPKYTIVINDWFVWTDEASSTENAITLAIQRFSKWGKEMFDEYRALPEEDRDKVYNIEDIRQEIKNIRVYNGFHQSQKD